MRDLAAIQRAFYGLVTSGQGAIDREVLSGSRHLNIYSDMYIDRLHDVLVDGFPKLRTVLGHESFRNLAVQFIRERPPTSFTVRDFGIELSEYLATRVDNPAGAGVNELPAWSANLAALERARVDVFDGRDAVAFTRDRLAAVPVEQFPELELRLIPASAVVPLQWTVDDLWSAVEDEATYVMPEPCQRWALVWRRESRVLHRTVDDDEASLVLLLARGATLAEVSARLAGSAAPEQRMVELLTRWLDSEVVTR